MPRIDYDKITDDQLRAAEEFVAECVDGMEFKARRDSLPFCNDEAYEKYGFVPQNVRAYRDRTGGGLRRKSTRRKSTRRKSIKRKSIKRKSIKRKSIKRKSTKRKSMKRKNTRRRRR